MTKTDNRKRLKTHLAFGKTRFNKTYPDKDTHMIVDSSVLELEMPIEELKILPFYF